MKLKIQILLSLSSLFLAAHAICSPPRHAPSPGPPPSIAEDPSAFPEAAPISGEDSPDPDEPSPQKPDTRHKEKTRTRVGGLAELCKQTEHAKLCESTIRPKLEPGEKATPMTALAKETEALAEESKKAAKAAKEAAKAKDRRNAESYEVCYEMFADCEDEARTAIEAMAANDMTTAKIRLSGALTYFETCDDAFAESARLKKLASNCLAIAAIN